MPAQPRKTYDLPSEESILLVPGVPCARMEYRGEETLVWADDWWEGGQPLYVLDCRAAPVAVAATHQVYLDALADGEKRGRELGFRAFQAAFRAMIGAVSGSDFDHLMRQVRAMTEES